MTATREPTSLILPEASAQSLATGGIGAALLAVERAHNGTGSWTTAHQLVKNIASGPVDVAAHTGLYYGGPAMLFLIDAAAADGHDRYAAARHVLDQNVRRLARERLTVAEVRLRFGRAATFAEYDLFYGLVGIGALLLRTGPDSDELGDLLSYLVRLTEPRVDGGQEVPGWWVHHDPDQILPTPGGHANFGMAHGAAGLLAVLSLAIRQGRQVDGQNHAIDLLCDWYDQWRQEDVRGFWWPQWVTRDQLRSRRPGEDASSRPSWCYGAPGIARALQLAAIATKHPARQAAAEAALSACLNGPQFDRLTGPGLCHGLAGLYHTAYRAAADARDPDVARGLDAVARRLVQCEALPDDGGLLTGRAGLYLALETARTNVPPLTRWDRCLLIA